jgi:hypothetical protein
MKIDIWDVLWELQPHTRGHQYSSIIRSCSFKFMNGFSSCIEPIFQEILIKTHTGGLHCSLHPHRVIHP